jgi:hypothetical protein
MPLGNYYDIDDGWPRRDYDYASMHRILSVYVERSGLGQGWGGLLFVWLRMRCAKLCGIFRWAGFSYLLLSDNNHNGCADHDGCADNYNDGCANHHDGYADYHDGYADYHDGCANHHDGCADNHNGYADNYFHLNHNG